MIQLLQKEDSSAPEAERKASLETRPAPSETETHVPDEHIAFEGEVFNLESEEDRLHLLQRTAGSAMASRVRHLIPAYATLGKEERRVILSEIQRELKGDAAISEPAIEYTTSYVEPALLGGVRRVPEFDVPSVGESESSVPSQEIVPEKDVSPEKAAALRFAQERAAELNELAQNPNLFGILTTKGAAVESLDQLSRVLEHDDAEIESHVTHVDQSFKALRAEVNTRTIPEEQQEVVEETGTEEQIQPESSADIEYHSVESEREVREVESQPEEVGEAWDVLAQHFEQELSTFKTESERDVIIQNVFESLGDDLDEAAVSVDPEALRGVMLNEIAKHRGGEQLEEKEVPPAEEGIFVEEKIKTKLDKALAQMEGREESHGKEREDGREEKTTEPAPVTSAERLEAEQPTDSFEVDRFKQNLDSLLDPLFGERTGFLTSTLAEGSGQQSKEWDYIANLSMSTAVTDGTIGLDELKQNNISVSAMDDVVRFLKEVRESADQQIIEGESVEHYLKRSGPLAVARGYAFKRVSH